MKPVSSRLSRMMNRWKNDTTKPIHNTLKGRSAVALTRNQILNILIRDPVVYRNMMNSVIHRAKNLIIKKNNAALRNALLARKNRKVHK